MKDKTLISISEARELIHPLVGKKVWGVKLSHYSFVTFEFGKSVLPDNEGGQSHGEFHLWLYDCTWKIQEFGTTLAESSDEYSDEQIQSSLDRLNGLFVANLVLIEPFWDAVINFSHSIDLMVFASSLDEENYIFFVPGDKSLGFGPGSKITIEE